MGKVILFTPVGGTDPISATNYYEGAILHIVDTICQIKSFCICQRKCWIIRMRMTDILLSG